MIFTKDFMVMLVGPFLETLGCNLVELQSNFNLCTGDTSRSVTLLQRSRID